METVRLHFVYKQNMEKRPEIHLRPSTAKWKWLTPCFCKPFSLKWWIQRTTREISLVSGEWLHTSGIQKLLWNPVLLIKLLSWKQFGWWNLNRLFKRWIALSTGQITIKWITLLVLVLVIRWIEIYPVDSAIHLLNNRGQVLIPVVNIEIFLCKRGVKGLLPDTWLSVFNFRERWKYEIKTRELWPVCLSWYVNVKIFHPIFVIFN